MRKKKLKVINLFGAPGNAKSSTRSGLFWLMKAHHMSVEEVSEYAKYLVLSGRKWQLKKEQLYLLSKQHHKQLIVERNGYEFAVTDSPLQLCSFYAPKKYYPEFKGLVDNVYDGFENINFLLKLSPENRGAEYEARGRVQSEAQALELDAKLEEFLKHKNIPYTEVTVEGLITPWKLFEHIKPGLAPWPRFDGPVAG